MDAGAVIGGTRISLGIPDTCQIRIAVAGGAVRGQAMMTNADGSCPFTSRVASTVANIR